MVELTTGGRLSGIFAAEDESLLRLVSVHLAELLVAGRSAPEKRSEELAPLDVTDAADVADLEGSLDCEPSPVGER